MFLESNEPALGIKKILGYIFQDFLQKINQ
jgi:hypothetical protein